MDTGGKGDGTLLPGRQVQREAELCMLRDFLPKPHIRSPNCSSIWSDKGRVSDGFGRLQTRRKEQELFPNIS